MIDVALAVKGEVDGGGIYNQLAIFPSFCIFHRPALSVPKRGPLVFFCIRGVPIGLRT